MSSKYTRRTGDGYVSRYRVSSGKVNIKISTIDIDWPVETTVAAVPHQDGIEITRDPGDRPVLCRSTVQDHGYSACFCVSTAGLRSLGVSTGDEVRVYQLGENSLLIVDADDDPRVVADGGSRFVCELCQDEHDTRADALRCCDDRFDDDLDERPSMSVVDEHGSPTVLTDGSGLRNETYLGVDDLLELAQEHAEDCDVIYHIRQARSLHNVRGGETDV